MVDLCANLVDKCRHTLFTRSMVKTCEWPQYSVMQWQHDTLPDGYVSLLAFRSSIGTAHEKVLLTCTCLRPEIDGTNVDRELEYAYRSTKLQVRGKRVEQDRNPVKGHTTQHIGNRSWIWGKVPTARDAVPRRHWRVSTLPMQPTTQCCPVYERM